MAVFLISSLKIVKALALFWECPDEASACEHALLSSVVTRCARNLLEDQEAAFAAIGKT